MNEPWHGTVHGYMNHKCRCDACWEETRRYRLTLLERPVPDHLHGRLSTYTTYGCRCEECCQTNSEVQRLYRERRKAARR